MKELNLHALSGLFYECHRVDPNALVDAKPPSASGRNCLQGLNNLWWQKALSDGTDRVITALEGRYSVCDPELGSHAAVLGNPAAFRTRVAVAPWELARLGSRAPDTFAALETLSVFCLLYTDFVSSPYSLSLQEGLLANELSSRALALEALDPGANPYLKFLEEFAFPVISHASPDLCWIVGPPKISTFAMAMFARQVRPDCHISIIGHASEYYSLAKIEDYLKRNDVLFQVVDSIILDDETGTSRQLRDALEHSHPLESVPNLMYFDEAAGEVCQTGYVVAAPGSDEHLHRHPRALPSAAGHIDPADMADIKLWPSTKCYWDQCNFCAINRKYMTLPKNDFSTVAEPLGLLSSLRDDGVTHVWSYDEAVPPPALGALARAILDAGLSITWATRSKIDRRFTPEICEALGQSGLREIRLGLESASPKVLSRMGKFPADWSLDLIEEVVSSFHAAGVSVHFPTIIGFPGETAAERQITYSFLQRIVARYPTVTFNINILGLDVASKLFTHRDEFGINNVRFPCEPRYFLGNLVDWDHAEVHFDHSQLDAERNEVMRSLLYPWIPTTATLPVYIFYRLAETSRATLAWKARRALNGAPRDELRSCTKRDAFVVSADTTAVGPIPQGPYAEHDQFWLYSWSTHHQLRCGASEVAFVQSFESPRPYDELSAPDAEVAERLFELGFLERTNDLADHCALSVLSPRAMRAAPTESVAKFFARPARSEPVPSAMLAS